ncbi:MAG: LysR family transcriptional regulator [Zoogloea sp.]|uniref:LysR family transcriptional regulator n=1 Tax=Zoogloea sp. TaxID=49181 RepID=UPI003F2CF481
MNSFIAIMNSDSRPDNLHLDLNLLLVFETILAERNISRAAERLDLAQPTVSNALNRLRRLTGDQLFVRTSKGMAPTPHAERIAQPLHQALAMLRNTLQAPRVFDPATANRSFTLYLTDLGEAFFLPRLLARLRVLAPGIRLVTLPMPDRNPQAALESGEVDIAIGNLPDLTTGFYQQRIFREHYICISRPDHPLLQGRMTSERFSQAFHAVVMPHGTGHGIVEQSLIHQGLQERIMLRLQNFLVLPAIVTTSDLLAIVPNSVAAQLSAIYPLATFPPPIALPRFDVKQCWHERFHTDAGNQWLRKQIAEIFMEGQAPLGTTP